MDANLASSFYLATAAGPVLASSLATDVELALSSSLAGRPRLRFKASPQILATQRVSVRHRSELSSELLEQHERPLRILSKDGVEVLALKLDRHHVVLGGGGRSPRSSFERSELTEQVAAGSA